MNNDDYWQEAVETSFEEAGIIATKEQIENIAGDMAGSHENYDMAFGYDVASQNFSSSQDTEIAKLREELQTEREKEGCNTCNGRGYITENGPCHSATSDCYKCHGEGKVLPGKQ